MHDPENDVDTDLSAERSAPKAQAKGNHKAIYVALAFMGGLVLLIVLNMK